MDSKKELLNLVKNWVMILLLMLASSCTIGRTYVGSELLHNPAEMIMPGQTTKSQILDFFGPPVVVQRQHDGDIFTYAYIRSNYSKLLIEEPIVTNLKVFTYSKTQQKHDILVILFDRDGTVKNFGFQRSTNELSPY
jgi:outer membrane protein assembly factor BamE (lipoprotein component of BamABCDE complex)